MNTSEGRLEMSPMHTRRPAWLDVIIDQQEAKARKSTPEYTYQGTADAYRFKRENGGEISTSQLIDTDEQLRILDLGAARAAFVLRARQFGHIAHAVSLHNYQGKYYSLTDQIPSNAYHVGNAERLDDIEGLLPEYDLVVSSKMYWLLVDPLGSLEQAFDRVAPGGTLAIETFPLKSSITFTGRQGSAIPAEAVKSTAERVGFTNVETARSQEYGHGPNFIDIYATRTEHSLGRAAFAYSYQLHDKTWIYVPARD